MVPLDSMIVVGDVFDILSTVLLHICAVITLFVVCLVSLLVYLRLKQGRTLGYMKKFPGRDFPVPMLATWKIHQTLSSQAHLVDYGVREKCFRSLSLEICFPLLVHGVTLERLTDPRSSSRCYPMLPPPEVRYLECFPHTLA